MSLQSQRIERDMLNVTNKVQDAYSSVRATVNNTRRRFVEISYPAIDILSPLMTDLSDFQRAVRGIVDTYLKIYVSDDGVEQGRPVASRTRKARTPGVLASIGRRAEMSQLHLIYMLKIVRVVIQVAVLYSAEHIFAEYYMRTMHVRTVGDPEILNDVPLEQPRARLTRLLWIFSGIDAVAQLVLIVSLVVVFYTYAKPGNSFAIDGSLITSYLVDSVTHSLVIIIVGYTLANVMMVKRFFEYPSRGLAVSKAYRNIMMTILIASTAVPYSMLFT